MECEYPPALTDSVEERKELVLATSASGLTSAASYSSKMSTRVSCQSIDGSNLASSHCVMGDDVMLAKNQDSEVHMNTPEKVESSPRYPVKTQGREEAKTSPRKRSQKTGKKTTSKVSHSILQHAEEVSNDVKASSILTLRVGGNGETRSDGNFSTQDVPAKIEQTISCQHNSLIQETKLSSSSLQQETRNQQIFNKKHDYSTHSSAKVSSDSSVSSQPSRHKRSSVKCSQSGKQIPLSQNPKPQVTDSGSHPVKVESVGVIAPIQKVDIQSQASSACLKRKAYEKSQSALLSHQKKTIPLPGRPPSVPKQKRSVPVPVSVPHPASLHIKWQGFEEPPKTVGYKCFICKRDLSFTAEGPVTQPAVPPFVAVLPCGHTFHDHCLQNITPQDQLKDPPCIPCAVGEV